MTSYTKSQLAYAAGVHPDSFRCWLDADLEYQYLCQIFHLTKYAKILLLP